MTTFRVLKFGGTSVSSRQRWETIADVVKQRQQSGVKPFVVCSALSGISNLLESLGPAAVSGEHESILTEIEARHTAMLTELKLPTNLLEAEFKRLSRFALGVNLTTEVSPRMHARIMAMGELMSTRLGAAFLSEVLNVRTQWLDAREMLNADRIDNEHRQFLSTTCDFQDDPDLQRRLGAIDGALLTQGFIANIDGETALLGRGGSDTSAAYFASKLNADELEIWTDVPGMYTANPRAISAAKLLKSLTYDEAQEIATTGAKVLHPRCIDPVRRRGIPLRIRCTPNPALDGTIVSNNTPDVGAQVKAISSKSGIILVSMSTLGMWQQVGFLADAFACFRDNGLSIDQVATSETNVTVSLDPGANPLESSVLDKLVSDLASFCEATVIGPCTAVSLVGHKIRAILHELGPALEAFEEQRIYLLSQAASDLNLTFVVDDAQADKLVERLHSLLFDDAGTDATFGPSWSALFEDAATNTTTKSAWWENKRDVLVEHAKTHGSAYVYDLDTVVAQANNLNSIRGVDNVYYAVKANSHPDVIKTIWEENCGLECVSPGELQHVADVLGEELHPPRIHYTPNFASRADYEFGLAFGCTISLDTLHPVRHWPEIFDGKDVFVRLDPGRGRGHHKFVKTAGKASKFGVSFDELTELAALAENHNFKIVGLHSHVGSGIRRAETWAETAVFLRSVAAGFPTVKTLNVGGGMGVQEKPWQSPLDLEAVSVEMEKFQAAHPGYKISIEPGRYLVADAGVLDATVTQTKSKGGAHYVGIETGMNTLIRPALYGSYHHIVNLTKFGEPNEMLADVVGPICESGDVLGSKRRLPKTEEGDVLLIATAGAYGRTMSSNYNLREPSLEIVLT